MIKVIQALLNKKHRNKLILAFIGSILASILELIGVSAIPAFIIVITDQENLHNLLTSYNLIFIVNFLNTISVYQLLL